jgi:hypothetical protein
MADFCERETGVSQLGLTLLVCVCVGGGRGGDAVCAVKTGSPFEI